MKCMGRALVMWLGGVLTCGGFEILHHKNTQPILNWKYPRLALVNEAPKLGSQEGIGGPKIMGKSLQLLCGFPPRSFKSAVYLFVFS